MPIEQQQLYNNKNENVGSFSILHDFEISTNTYSVLVWCCYTDGNPSKRIIRALKKKKSIRNWDLESLERS